LQGVWGGSHSRGVQWRRRSGDEAATTYADNVAVALYRRAAVRRAAVDQYLLPAATCGPWIMQRQTDGRTPYRFIDPAPSLWSDVVAWLLQRCVVAALSPLFCLVSARRHTCQRLLHQPSHSADDSLSLVSVCHCNLQRNKSMLSLDPRHSLFHSRLKSFLFCESSQPQPFLSLLQDSLYGFPRLFTATSEHIRLFTF